MEVCARCVHDDDDDDDDDDVSLIHIYSHVRGVTSFHFGGRTHKERKKKRPGVRAQQHKKEKRNTDKNNNKKFTNHLPPLLVLLNLQTCVCATFSDSPATTPHATIPATRD